MNVAVIQLGAGSNKVRNVDKAVKMVERAARRAEFILLPEVFNYRGKADSRKGHSAAAEIIPGPSLTPLMAVAALYKIHILAGSVCERIPKGTKVYNTSVLIGPGGEILARYRKAHLFDAQLAPVPVKESRWFHPGRGTVTQRIGPWCAGLSICYDLRFPVLYQSEARDGAEILCVPSAFTKITGKAHWKVLLRARAVENLCYVLAPNQIGPDGNGMDSYGNSMIIDPWGTVIARASADKEETLYARLDKKTLMACRNKLPGQSNKKTF